jgi:hypothetical protein
VELRARQRTYHGAYLRTALGALGYALVVLKLFDRRFYRSKYILRIMLPVSPLLIVPVVGLVYLLLSGLLFIASLMRAAHSNHDFADEHKANEFNVTNQNARRDVRPVRVISSVGQGGRNFGRPFVTSGWIVVAVTAFVSIVEVGLLVLVAII